MTNRVVVADEEALANENETSVQKKSPSAGRSSVGTRAVYGRAPMSRTPVERQASREVIDEVLGIIDRSQIEIPERVKERFLKLDGGYKLRWVRFREGVSGADDVANVHKRRALRYSFVKAEEVPELQGGLRQTQTSNFGDLITVGDLALAKVPLEYAEAHSAALAEKVMRVSQNALSEINKPGIKSMIRGPGDPGFDSF